MDKPARLIIFQMTHILAFMCAQLGLQANMLKAGSKDDCWAIVGWVVLCSAALLASTSSVCIRKKKEFMFVPENLQSAGGVSRSTTVPYGFPPRLHIHPSHTMTFPFSE